MTEQQDAPPPVAEPPSADSGSKPDQSVVSPPKEMVPVEQLKPEVLTGAALSMVQSESVRAYKTWQEKEKAKKPQASNTAERSLVLLGRMLDAPQNDPSKPVSVDLTRCFAKNEGLPRLRASKERPGGHTISFDHRPVASDENPTTLADDEIELTSFNGRSEQGLHFIGRNAKGEPQHVYLTEQELTQLYLVTQSIALSQGLQEITTKPDGISSDSALGKEDSRAVMATLLSNSSDFITTRREEIAKNPNTDPPLEIGLGLDPKKVESAVARVAVSRNAGVSLAENMRTYVGADKRLSEDTRRKTDAQLEEIMGRMKDGLQPTADELFSLLVLSGEPSIQEGIQKIDRKIESLEALAHSKPEGSPAQKQLLGQIDELRQARKSMREVLEGGKTSQMYRFLEDVQAGKASPEIVDKLSKKLSGLRDPGRFFEVNPEDLNDENSITFMITEHFMNKANVKLTKEQRSSLLTFLSEHKSDLALMGIYFLLQTLSTTVNKALQEGK